MIRRTGAQVGLLAFALALAAGLYAGNTPLTILTRALVALLAGTLTGRGVAWTAQLILNEYVQKRKAELDAAHVERVRALQAEEPPVTAGETR